MRGSSPRQAVTCPARNPQLRPSACPAFILRITDSREIQRCRACPHGQALVATAPAIRPIPPENPEEARSAPPPVALHPETNKEEVPRVENEKPTYTMKELAELLGYNLKDVQNARYVKTVNPVPGTKIHAVREAMRERNITWEQIVSEKVRREAARAAKAPMPENLVPAKLEQESSPAIESPLPAKPAASEDPPALEGVPLTLSIPKSGRSSGTIHLGIRPETSIPATAPEPSAPARSPESPVPDTAPNFDAERVTNEELLALTAPEKKHALLAAPETEEPWVDINAAREYALGGIALEDLITEITRRLPKAEVILRGGT